MQSTHWNIAFLPLFYSSFDVKIKIVKVINSSVCRISSKTVCSFHHACCHTNLSMNTFLSPANISLSCFKSQSNSSHSTPRRSDKMRDNNGWIGSTSSIRHPALSPFPLHAAGPLHFEKTPRDYDVPLYQVDEMITFALPTGTTHRFLYKSVRTTSIMCSLITALS